MDAKLRLIAGAYSEADLLPVQAQVPAIATETGWKLDAGIGCTPTGDWGLTVTRYGVASTPEVLAETEARFAPFGDRVHLRYCECVITPAALTLPAPQPAPSPAPQPAPIRVGDYVKRPVTSRCIHGRTLSVSVKAGAKSVRLRAGKRHASGKRARLALKQRTTRVTVTVTLRDGRTASQTLTFRRC
jgi:hypothetical protein